MYPCYALHKAGPILDSEAMEFCLLVPPKQFFWSTFSPIQIEYEDLLCKYYILLWYFHIYLWMTQPRRQILVPRTSPSNVPRTSPKNPIWQSRGRPELTFWGCPDPTSKGRLEMASWGRPNLPFRECPSEVVSGRL